MYGVDASKKTSKLKKSYFVNASKKTEKLKKCYVVGADKKLVKLWSGGFSNISYYGALTPSASATGSSFASVGDYAIFAGGTTLTGYMSGYIHSSTDVVSTYDSSLTFSTGNVTLSNQRSDMASASTSNHAFFAGGVTANLGANPQTVVDVFDASLTRSSATSLSAIYTLNMCGLSMNGNVAFTGGAFSGGCLTTLTVYDDSLTKNEYDIGLSERTNGTIGTTVGNYALFGDRWITTKTNTLDVVDNSYTKLSSISLTTSTATSIRYYYAETVGGYALFIESGSGINKQYVIDASLTVSSASLSNVSLASSSLRGHTSVEGYALFTSIISTSASLTAYVYDESLTLTTFDMEGLKRDGSTAGHVGNYIIVYGGDDNSDSYMVKSADVFQLS